MSPNDNRRLARAAVAAWLCGDRVRVAPPQGMSREQFVAAVVKAVMECRAVKSPPTCA